MPSCSSMPGPPIREVAGRIAGEIAVDVEDVDVVVVRRPAERIVPLHEGGEEVAVAGDEAVPADVGRQAGDAAEVVRVERELEVVPRHDVAIDVLVVGVGGVAGRREVRDAVRHGGVDRLRDHAVLEERLGQEADVVDDDVGALAAERLRGEPGHRVGEALLAGVPEGRAERQRGARRHVVDDLEHRRALVAAVVVQRAQLDLRQAGAGGGNVAGRRRRGDALHAVRDHADADLRARHPELRLDAIDAQRGDAFGQHRAGVDLGADDRRDLRDDGLRGDAIDVGGGQRGVEHAAILADPRDADAEGADRGFGVRTAAQVDARAHRAVRLDAEDRQAAAHRADTSGRRRLGGRRGALVGAQQRADLDLLPGSRGFQRTLPRQGRFDLGPDVRREDGVGLPGRGIDLQGLLDERVGEHARVGLLGPDARRRQETDDDERRDGCPARTERRSGHGELLRKTGADRRTGWFTIRHQPGGGADASAWRMRRP